MFSKVFLAMTARELQEDPKTKAAYMACRFSPYGKGLTNLPTSLPENSILLLDDSIPIDGHDPKTVTHQLLELIRQFSVHALLLDLQRTHTPEMQAMVDSIVKALPCPVAATTTYGKTLNCPVFLPPAPANKSLKTYLSPWLQRGVFLEIASDTLQITVTETGSIAESDWDREPRELPLTDKKLHCHYQVKVSPQKAIFTLRRTKEDLAALADEAHQLGVLGTVGIYQELRKL